MSTSNNHERRPSRRDAVAQDLGLVSEVDVVEAQQKALEAEQARRDKREAFRRDLEENSMSYGIARSAKTYLDDYYLDPILGFFLPGIGDAIMGMFSLPFVYLALFKIRSIPLALALVYNILIDCLLGMIPFFIGDVFDLFNKAFKKNYRLIVGFVEEDQNIISEVKSRATYMAIAIGVLIFLIYKMIDWLGQLIDYISSL